jgi:hypothetical protein
MILALFLYILIFYPARVSNICNTITEGEDDNQVHFTATTLSEPVQPGANCRRTEPPPPPLCGTNGGSPSGR